MSDKICALCNKKLGLLNFKYKLKDGLLCSGCIDVCEYLEEETPSYKNKTVEEAGADFAAQKALDEKNKEEISHFDPTNTFNDSVYFNDNTKRWYTSEGTYGKVPHVYDYSDILDFQLIRNTKYEEHDGIKEKYILGFNVEVIVRSETKPRLLISTPKMYKSLEGSNAYRKGLAVATILICLFEDAKNKANGEIKVTVTQVVEPQAEEAVHKDPVPAEELLQLKELYDLEVITKEEFEQKKKNLLGL